MDQEMQDLVKKLASKARTPEEMFGSDGLLKALTKALVDGALEAEMTDHLGYEKHAPEGRGSGNSRNGSTNKRVKSNLGDVDIAVPRDRNGEFEPQMVRKGHRRIDGFDDKILALYARGMSTRDIQDHLRDIYGSDVSPTLISRVTDAVLDEVHAWQNRPLERLYAILYLDALWIKVRHHGRVVKKAVYVVIGINEDGVRDVLGLWLSETEGASTWLQIVTELQHRGVEDILIACVDGLKGLPEAIEAVFPRTQVQLCIVHLLRNSTRSVNWKDRKKVAATLRTVYSAGSEAAARTKLREFRDAWPKYPQVADAWERNWEHVIPMFGYAQPIRRIIYTTNAIEALNSSIRKVIRNKGSFPNDESAMKLIFLTLRKHRRKGWKNPVWNWTEARSQLAIIFGDRMTNDDLTPESFTQKS
jgi:putative transposase